MAVRQTGAEDRVFFLDAESRQHSLPVGWTDAAGPDVSVTVAAGARSRWWTCWPWRGWQRAAGLRSADGV